MRLLGGPRIFRVAGLSFGVVALEGEQPFAAVARVATMARWDTEIIQQWLSVADVTHWTAKEGKAQRCAIGIVEQLILVAGPTTVA